MKSKLHKDPLIVALGLTVLALLILPHRYGVYTSGSRGAPEFTGHYAFEYRFVTGSWNSIHWPTFAVELIVIWIGFLVFQRIIKLRQNEE